MTKHREILRLKSLGISEREIATSCSVSRNTVARVCKRADASAIIYSIVETAKANGINVRDYLEYLLTVMPKEEWRKDPEILDSLTPCSPEIRKKVKN